jgi:hypothetical protein
MSTQAAKALDTTFFMATPLPRAIGCVLRNVVTHRPFFLWRRARFDTFLYGNAPRGHINEKIVNILV